MFAKAIAVGLTIAAGVTTWAFWPADPAARVVLAAMPEERLPEAPMDIAIWDVQQGVGHLKIAAKSGSPALLQEAEREVLLGLLDGLETAAAEGHVDRGHYDRVFEAYEYAQGVFKELPYRLMVEPGRGLRPFELTLRRHPWLTVLDRPVKGWHAEMIESGVRLTPGS